MGVVRLGVSTVADDERVDEVKEAWRHASGVGGAHVDLFGRSTPTF
jgi:hypothetical protein